MQTAHVQEKVEEATLEFTLGNSDKALEIIGEALSLDANSFQAWLTKAEILLAEDQFEAALKAAEKAYAIDSKNVHINTSLSRIWVALKNKQNAEYYGAQARMLGWKEEIQDSS